MAHRHELTHVAAEVISKMDDRIVLNITTGTNRDLIDIAPKGSIIPEAGFLAKSDTSNDVRARGNEC
jgi:hypothetical protein